MLDRDCDIYRIERYKITFWVTTLEGLRVALKYEQGEGPNKTSFIATRIDLGSPADELFQPPPKYRKAFVWESITYIEDRYIKLDVKYPLSSVCFDMTTITLDQDDHGQEYIDLRLRTDEFAKKRIIDRERAGLPVAGYEQYLYTLTHLQLLRAGKYRILSVVDYTGDGRPLSSDNTAGDWLDIEPNSLFGHVFEAIMPFIEANEDNLQLNMP